MDRPSEWFKSRQWGGLCKTKPYSDKQPICEVKQRNKQFEKLNPVCEYGLNRIKAQRPDFDQIYHYLFFFQIRFSNILTIHPVLFSDNLANYNLDQVNTLQFGPQE